MRLAAAVDGGPGAGGLSQRATQAAHHAKRGPALIPRSAPKADDGLGDYLREWRRSTAKRLGMPAFIVMHDTSLEELCRVRPKSLRELNSITGFGERKIEAYGEQIIEALREFERGARAVIPRNARPRPRKRRFGY